MVLLLVLSACSRTTPHKAAAGGKVQSVAPGGTETTTAGGPGAVPTSALPGSISPGGVPGSGGAGAPGGRGGGSGSVGGGGGAGGSGSLAGGGSASAGGAGSGSGGSPAGSQGAEAAAGKTVGVTKNTITISAMAGFSGNYGAILNTIYDRGFGTWVDDVNAHGGIHGRKVVAKKVDNQDSADGGVAACKEIQNNGSYLALSIVGFGNADVSASDCLDRAGITTLALNLSGWSNSWTHVYSAGDAGKQTKPLASFIQKVIGDHGKVGIIHTNDPVNSAGRAALVQEMRRLGVNLVHEETVSVNQASYVAEVSHMRSAGATTVALIENTNEVTGTLRDAKAIGYSPNWTGNYWVTDENSTAARSLLEGIKAIRNYSSTNSAAFADYKAKAVKYGHGDVANSTTMALYGIGLLVGKVLDNAGPTPTKASLPHAIEAITNYNNGVTMALSFGPGVRVADVGMWPIQCCNSDNTWKGIGDAKSVF
ncbi:MAG: ABC transporter substrate-binding protein [Acidimicrobiales bacterium]